MNKFIHGGFTYKECKVISWETPPFEETEKEEPKKGIWNKQGRRKTKHSVIELKKSISEGRSSHSE